MISALSVVCPRDKERETSGCCVSKTRTGGRQKVRTPNDFVASCKRWNLIIPFGSSSCGGYLHNICESFYLYRRCSTTAAKEMIGPCNLPSVFVFGTEPATQALFGGIKLSLYLCRIWTCGRRRRLNWQGRDWMRVKAEEEGRLHQIDKVKIARWMEEVSRTATHAPKRELNSLLLSIFKWTTSRPRQFKYPQISSLCDSVIWWWWSVDFSYWLHSPIMGEQSPWKQRQLKMDKRNRQEIDGLIHADGKRHRKVFGHVLIWNPPLPLHTHSIGHPFRGSQQFLQLPSPLSILFIDTPIRNQSKIQYLLNGHSDHFSAAPY